MPEGGKPLLDTIRRAFPNSRFDPVGGPRLAAIRHSYPEAPEHYLAFLRDVGYGPLGDNFMFYDGLCTPEDLGLFDPQTLTSLKGILFFGDNFGGEIFGFDTGHAWRIVSVDLSYSSVPDLQQAQTMPEFVEQRIRGS